MGALRGEIGGARSLTRPADARPTPTARTLSAGDIAWLAAVPAALIAVLAIWLLGPPVGRALLAPPNLHFWSAFQIGVRPEPVEQGRFLVALAAPFVLATLALAGIRRRPARASAASDLLVAAAQVAILAFAVLCMQRQRALFGTFYPSDLWRSDQVDVFSPATLLVAGAATLAAAPLARSARLRGSLARWSRETSVTGIVAGLASALAIGVWLLAAFYTEDTIRAAHREVLYHFPFTLDETFAVLDGRSPLVDFAAQYGSLWPYAFAAVMSLTSSSVGVWVALALCTTGVGMFAIYAVLRRVAHSSIRGLVLFLPVLASSFFIVDGTLENRYTYANYYGTFPMRYAGPSILAWLVARRLGGVGPHRAWWLFLAGGVVALNNVEVGLAALGATAAAIVWGRERPASLRARQLLLEAAAGLAVAFALVSALTLVRAGALPHPEMLLRYARLFGRGGFAMSPMPTLGLHTVIYLTYVAAIGVATVRAVRAEPDRALTGMLAWSGVFGLGAGAYYAGRSAPETLVAMFFPWSFAVALLVVPALRGLGEASWRRPPIAAVACVFAFFVLAGSLAQTPTPWGQLHRLRQSAEPVFAQPTGQRFVAQHTHAGEPVAILLMLGHRIGASLGLTNVSPYSNSLSLITAQQLDEIIEILRAAGGDKVFLDPTLTSGDMLKALEDAGYAFVAGEPNGEAGLWVDRGSR